MAKSSNHTYHLQKWVNLSTFGKILALGINLALQTPVGGGRLSADNCGQGRGGGVKNWQNFADVFYGWPLTVVLLDVTLKNLNVYNFISSIYKYDTLFWC